VLRGREIDDLYSAGPDEVKQSEQDEIVVREGWVLTGVEVEVEVEVEVWLMSLSGAGWLIFYWRWARKKFEKKSRLAAELLAQPSKSVMVR
jgi:hypothetical protein